MAAGNPPEPSDRTDPAGSHRLVVEEPSQVFRQGRGRCVAIDGTFGQRFQDDRFQVAGDPAVEQPRRNGIPAADLFQQFRGTAPIERGPQRHQFIKRGSQAIDVGSPIDGSGSGLLGAHVTGSAQQAVMLGQPGIGKSACQPKIGDPDRSLLVDQEIGRLDVAMNDAVMVCVRQGFRGLQTDLGDPAEVGGAARRFKRRQRGRLHADGRTKEFVAAGPMPGPEPDASPGRNCGWLSWLLSPRAGRVVAAKS